MFYMPMLPMRIEQKSNHDPYENEYPQLDDKHSCALQLVAIYPLHEIYEWSPERLLVYLSLIDMFVKLRFGSFLNDVSLTWDILEKSLCQARRGDTRYPG